MLYFAFSRKTSIKKKLQAKNNQIFYYLQFFFIKASFLGLSLSFAFKLNLLLFY